MSTLEKHEGHSIVRICMQCTQVCLCDRKNTKHGGPMYLLCSTHGGPSPSPYGLVGVITSLHLRNFAMYVDLGIYECVVLGKISFLASYPALPMFFNVAREKSDFSCATLKNMGRAGYEANHSQKMIVSAKCVQLID